MIYNIPKLLINNNMNREKNARQSSALYMSYQTTTAKKKEKICKHWSHLAINSCLSTVGPRAIYHYVNASGQVGYVPPIDVAFSQSDQYRGCI